MSNQTSINVQFKINFKCDFGFSVYISGNSFTLGEWDVSRCVKMTWSEGHTWTADVNFTDNEPEEINYKYFTARDEEFKEYPLTWEKGINRKIDLSTICSSSLTQNDSWEQREVKLMVKDFLPLELQGKREVYLVGDILNILKSPNPIKMTLKELKNPRNPEQNVKFWTTKISLHYSVEEFRYKFILYDTQRSVFIKNRKISKIYSTSGTTSNVPAFFQVVQQMRTNCSSSSEAGVGPVAKASAEWYGIHCNTFAKADYPMYSDFIFDRICPNILLGSSINDPIEVSILKEQGVCTIMNLQMKDDIRRHNSNHDEVVLCCKEKEIQHISFPIDERNQTEIVEKCNKASRILKALLDESKVVYLHCTYGANRSVHSLISYLCLFEKFEIEEAIKFVQSKRALAVPSFELSKYIIQN